MGVALALVFELHQMEADRPHELDVRIIGEDGAEIARVQGGFQTQVPPELNVGEELLVPVALDLRNAGLPGPGAYSIEIAVDGTHQRTLQFWSDART
jgi:hypothetical protein